MKGGGKTEGGRSVFLFKRAERLERVEPAANCRRGEGGSGGIAIRQQKRFCQLKGISRPLSGKQVRVGLTSSHESDQRQLFYVFFLR